MNTTTLPRPNPHPRWPDPLGPLFRPRPRPEPTPQRLTPLPPSPSQHDFLVINPHPEFIAPDTPPPADLTFFNIDFL